MKRYLAAAGVILLILCIFAGCKAYLDNGPRQTGFSRVGSTSLKNEKIGHYRLLLSLSALTPPPAAENNNDLYDYYDAGRGVRFATKKNGDAIIRIILESGAAHLTTAKGIGIGATKKEVVSAYGAEFYDRLEQGADIVGYVDKELNQTLEFWLFDGRVNRIRFDIGEMN